MKIYAMKNGYSETIYMYQGVFFLLSNA